MKLNNKRVVQILKQYFANSNLRSFGIKSQFIELVFGSKQFDDIVVSIDCPISSNAEKINAEVNAFKRIDKDTYEIVFFLFVNRQHIISSSINLNENLTMEFSNGIELTFHLEAEDASIGFAFKKNESHSNFDIGFMIEYGEIIGLYDNIS